MSNKAKLVINIEFESELTEEQRVEVRHLLDHAAQHLAANGMLSGDNPDLVIERWNETITV